MVIIIIKIFKNLILYNTIKKNFKKGEKLKKTLKQKNQVQIYIREKHKPIWMKFVELTRKDDDFNKLRLKEGFGVVSIAIMNLIYAYVIDKEPDFINTLNNETPNKIDNQEAETD